MSEILILYYSRGGSVTQLARQVARGVEEVADMQARLRTVPPVLALTATASPAAAEDGAPYVELRDLRECAVGLILGSPTRFGNMAAPLKHFLMVPAEWVFGHPYRQAGRGIHFHRHDDGGQESTLLSMIIPLLHDGMSRRWACRSPSAR